MAAAMMPIRIHHSTMFASDTAPAAVPLAALFSSKFFTRSHDTSCGSAACDGPSIQPSESSAMKISPVTSAIAIAPPTKNMVRLNSRYIVPMSLWFVENSHRPMPLAGP